ncbi:MAG: prepilin-type N-terminal cleavage/methylation domain-containing protein [Blastocatellia bacterium]|jgi:type II secretory pathway pseudopilin PulG|nr:prepilin-type N-terminal cleavage/methylation domain-containing protein [Blastocatellia bacterium]MBK6424950.1 prepilin-type N-terminal cleavage/methylation domain-containing protein [Blastocatellia bacterium]
MRRNPESGFTLLEAMVAALILLIAIILVAQLFITAMQQNRTSRQYTHATAIAQSKLEELNAIPIEKLAYGGELGGTDDGGGKGAAGFFEYVAIDLEDNGKIGVVEEREQANYARFWRIDPDPEGWLGVYRISVRVVALRDGDAGEREEVTLATVRSQF